MSRAKSRRNLDYMDVLRALEEKGISIRVASPKLVMEEAPESYKNVTDVVDTCKDDRNKSLFAFCMLTLDLLLLLLLLLSLLLLLLILLLI